jgi:hypothetical protein
MPIGQNLLYKFFRPCFAFISNLLIILFLGEADVSGLGAVHPRLQACTWPIRHGRFAA